MINSINTYTVRRKAIISAGIALALLLIASPVIAASKPRPPITVIVVPAGGSAVVQNPLPTDPRDLEAVILSALDVREVTATIECYDGAVLVQGPSAWTGPMAGRIEKRIPLTVRPAPSGKGKVRVSVIIAGAGGPAFTTQAFYDFSPPGSRQKAAPDDQRKKTVRKDRSGRNVVEHPVR